MIYAWLFLLSAGLNILVGARAWPSVLAGSLNDPDSYMRLLRIERGIQAGHLLLRVARDDSGAGVMVEWSRLLDMLLWLMAALLAPWVGWHRALFVAGVALGPLGAGALGAALVWVAAPFARREYLWLAALAPALLPGMEGFAAPGVVHYHILLLALIALTVGFAARAWGGDWRMACGAGLSGGAAIWLTVETMPFVLMAFAALFFRWIERPSWRVIGGCAVCFAGMLALALALDPPQGGYGVPEVDRLSCVYVVLGFLLLLGALGLAGLEGSRLRVAGGVALMAVLFLLWLGLFPKVAMGPYGIIPKAEMTLFFGVIQEAQPVRGMALITYLLPGFWVLLYALWRGMRGRGWVWMYIALCAAFALWLGVEFVLFTGFAAAAAAASLPIMVTSFSALLAARPYLAAGVRSALLAAMFGLPELAASASAAPHPGLAAIGRKFPSCALRTIGPLLAPVAGKVVLAPMEDTPELLYRSKVETVGSLYQHGVPAFLRARAAWRAIPGTAEPAAVKATGASDILFCPQPGRYAPVADLAPATLWDRLEVSALPSWLRLLGQNEAGWRLYEIVASTPPRVGAATPVVPGSDSGRPRSDRTAR
jgi:hypothetical protein